MKIILLFLKRINQFSELFYFEHIEKVQSQVAEKVRLLRLVRKENIINKGSTCVEQMKNGFVHFLTLRIVIVDVMLLSLMFEPECRLFYYPSFERYCVDHSTRYERFSWRMAKFNSSLCLHQKFIDQTRVSWLTFFSLASQRWS